MICDGKHIRVVSCNISSSKSIISCHFNFKVRKCDYFLIKLNSILTELTSYMCLFSKKSKARDLIEWTDAHTNLFYVIVPIPNIDFSCAPYISFLAWHGYASCSE